MSEPTTFIPVKVKPAKRMAKPLPSSGVLSFCFVGDFLTTRPVFLELAEKLSAIVDHRLRMTRGDEADDGEVDDWETATVGNDDGESDGDPLELIDAEHDDGQVDTSRFGVEDIPMLEGEERRPSQLFRDDQSENGSIGPDLPFKEPSASQDITDDNEWKTTCALHGFVHEAKHFANQHLFVTKNGRNLVLLDVKKYVGRSSWQSGMGGWVIMMKDFRKWMRRIHRGCDGLLSYDPITDAVYEINLGWNIAMVMRTTYGFGADEAPRVLEELERDAMAWALGKRWVRRECEVLRAPGVSLGPAPTPFARHEIQQNATAYGMLLSRRVGTQAMVWTGSSGFFAYIPAREQDEEGVWQIASGDN